MRIGYEYEHSLGNVCVYTKYVIQSFMKVAYFINNTHTPGKRGKAPALTISA